MDITELIGKYINEVLTFKELYKNYVTYENDKLQVKFTKEHRSQLYLKMSLNEIDFDGDIFEITEK